MKPKLLYNKFFFIFFLFFFQILIAQDLVTIPDPNFEQALIDLAIDSDGVVNQSILRSDAEAATELLLNFPTLPNGQPNRFADERLTITEKITDLTGIEAFVNMTNLGVGYNALTSIDVSNNTALTELFVNDNQLTEIDVTNNTLLTRLGVMRNPFTASTVDTSNNILLEELYLHLTGISAVDISANTNLITFYVFGNNLTELDASQKTNLTRLYANDNQLTSVNIDANTQLTQLRLQNNQITDIDVTQNTELTLLLLENNNLSSVDVSQNTKLVNLAVGINPLTSLDVTTNVNLSILTAEVTQISSIDVSKNVNLTQFFIFDNPNLTQLDVSKNPLLFNLGVKNTSISVLDLSNNNIKSLFAFDNPNLMHVDMRNGNNINVTAFQIYNTPNLTCINSDANYDPLVDIEVPVEISQIMVDSGKTFSEDCGDFITIPDPNFEQALIDLAIDSDGVVNQSILRSDAETVTELNVNDKAISDLTGIEAFVNLSNLECRRNELTTLNLTNNAALTILECENNQLTQLDVTQNPLLRILGFSNNFISEIDVTQNLELTAFFGVVNNLTSVNLDANTKLAVYGLASNPLTYVSLKNGNNANVVFFTADDTPNLDCINSDAIVPASMTSSGKTFSEDCSTSIAGRWIMAPEAGSLKVGGGPGSDPIFFSIPDNQVLSRACYYDDVYEFGADGSFKNIVGDETYLEPFQGVAEGCGTPVAPYDGSVEATYTYNQLEGTITLNGLGSYLGLPKVYNEATLDEPSEPIPSDSITYNVSFSDNGNSMTIEILSEGFLYWTFKLVKESVFIPDANFEQALLDLQIDTDGEINKRISRSDAEAVTELSLFSPIFNQNLPNVLEKISDVTGIEAFVNLTFLSLRGNLLTEIELDNLINLNYLDITSNNLNEIDVTKNVLLENFIILNNNLSELNVSNNPLLKLFGASQNNLSNLDLSNNPTLDFLQIDNNQLTELDLTGNPNLRILNINNNNLSSLELGEKNQLIQIVMGDNLIEDIDLSTFANLTTFFAKNNLFTSIDLSQNPLLNSIQLSDNSLLESLSIKNGNNNNLSFLEANNNLNLSCIEVDQNIVGTSPNNWTKDANAIYSSDCATKPEYVFIPDPNFEQSLIDIGIDSDGVVNTWVLKADAEAISSLNLTNPLFDTSSFSNPLIVNVTEKIADLTGLAAFVNLTNFQIANSDIASIDVSNLVLLEELFVSRNQLSTINITNNTNLRRFGVMYNPIIDATIDVSQNTLLEELFVHQTGISFLDISNNQLLNRLDAQFNPGLSVTTATSNPALTSLNLSGTGLSNYNGVLFPNVERLFLSNNQLTKFNGNNSLFVQFLNLAGNQISSLNLSNNAALLSLNASGNLLTELDLRNGNNQNLIPYNNNGTELPAVDVIGNLLTCISVDDPTDVTLPYDTWALDPGVILSSNCKAEEDVVLIPDSNFEDALIALGLDTNGSNGNILLSEAEAIINLDVSGQAIMDLTGVEAFVNLTELNIADNLLESVNLMENTNLITANVSNNMLSSLEITSGRDLLTLNSSGNNLVSIDLSSFTDIQTLDVSDNDLQVLDLRGLSNLVNFDSTLNSNLLCIGVDDPGNIPVGWDKDDVSNYSSSSDCISPTIISQTVTVSLDNKGEATVNPIDFDNGSTDNVTDNANLIFEADIVDFDCSNLGPNSVELTVTDEAGNQSVETVSVIVLDDILPTVTAENTFTADVEGGIYTLNPLDIVKSSGDNCSVDSFEVSQELFSQPGAYEVELVAIDASGNRSEPDTTTVEITDSAGSAELKFGGITATIYSIPIGDELNILFSKSVNLGSLDVQLLPTGGGAPINITLSQNNGNGDFTIGNTIGIPAGSYILQVTLGNKTDSVTVIKI